MAEPVMMSGGFREVYKHLLLSTTLRRFKLRNLSPRWTYVEFLPGNGALAEVDKKSTEYQRGLSRIYAFSRKAYADRRLHLLGEFVNDLGVALGKPQKWHPAEVSEEPDTYLSGGFALASKYLSEKDRVIFIETNEDHCKELQKLHENDDRVETVRVAEPTGDVSKALFPPLTPTGVCFMDVDTAWFRPVAGKRWFAQNQGMHDQFLEKWGKEAKEAIRRWPYATHVIAYPVLNGVAPVPLLRWIKKSGAANIINTCVKSYDEEVGAGIGVCVVNPPDGYLTELEQQLPALKAEMMDPFASPVEASTDQIFLTSLSEQTYDPLEVVSAPDKLTWGAAMSDRRNVTDEMWERQRLLEEERDNPNYFDQWLTYDPEVEDQKLRELAIHPEGSEIPQRQKRRQRGS